MGSKRLSSLYAALLVLAMTVAGCAASSKSTLPVATNPVNESIDVVPAFEDEGWKDYLDLDHDSNVVSYHCGEDYIEVEFTTGPVYRYTYESAGSDNVERMKELAQTGEGLNAYINAYAKYLYEGYVAPVQCGPCLGEGSIVCVVCLGKGAFYCTMCDRTGLDDCWMCGGAGGSRCTPCKGTGVETCFGCGGAGAQQCYVCGGTGFDYFRDACTACGGAGLRVCSFCAGRGGQLCSFCGEDGWSGCTMCGETGAITCIGCDGSLEDPCSACGSTGRIPCQGCSGTGSLTP